MNEHARHSHLSSADIGLAGSAEKACALGEAEARLEQMLDMLRQRGMRLTPQREAIIRLLAADCSHPSAEDVLARLAPDHPWLSKATVYNTLNSLLAAGIIQDVDLGHERRFDGRTLDPHGHLTCRACGKVEDFDLSPAVRAALAASSESGFATERIQVKLVGLCRACAAIAENH